MKDTLNKILEDFYDCIRRENDGKLTIGSEHDMDEIMSHAQFLELAHEAYYNGVPYHLFINDLYNKKDSKV